MSGLIVVGILLALLVLVKATDVILDAVRHMVREFGVNPFGMASLVLAFSTSLPELSVGITAALQGKGDLVLGNILGSNIANLTMVVGGAAMISGVLRSTDEFLKREVVYVFLAGSFPMLLLLDRSLTRVDGIILLMVYGLYNLTVLERKRKHIAQKTLTDEPTWKRILVKVNRPQTEKSIGRLILGIGLMVGAANVIVSLASNLALMMGISPLLVGLLVISLGTVIPELVFEIEAIRKHEIQMAFGNVLGSVVVNSTGILGLVAIISPVSMVNGLQPYLLASMAFVTAFFVFWGLVWTKHRLDRWEGGILVGLYLLFALTELF